MELIPKRMISRHILVVFLVAVVIFIVKNITAFLIVESLIEGYMLIASTDTIVSSYFFTSNSASLYFRLNYWLITILNPKRTPVCVEANRTSIIVHCVSLDLNKPAISLLGIFFNGI